MTSTANRSYKLVTGLIQVISWSWW